MHLIQCIAIFWLLCDQYITKITCDQIPKIYTAVSAPFIYPQSDYEILVFTDSGHPTKFSATVACGQSIYNSSEIIITDQNPGQILLKIGDFKSKFCNLTLTDGNGDGKTQIIQTEPDDFVFIHTDRPIYKPQDTIKFRVLVLDRKSKPKSREVQIRVRDSKNNLIKLWKSSSTNNFGVFSDKLDLSDEPNLGEWKIQASLSKDKRTGKKFLVSEYVPPKFDADIYLPEYRVISDIQPILMLVRARSNWGKFVNGTCKVDVSLWKKSCDENHSRNLTSVTFPIDGDASKEIRLNSRIIAKAKNGSKLEFRTTVTESGSDASIVREKSVVLVLYEYQIRPVDKVSFNRWGLPFLVDFQILDRENQLIKNPGDTATITHNFPGTAPSYTASVVDGVVQCNFTDAIDRSESDHRFIEITYKSLKYRYIPPEKKYFWGKPISRHAILIDLVSSKNVETNQTLKMLVKSTTELESVNWLVVSNHKIVSAGKKQNQRSKQFYLDIAFSKQDNFDQTVFVFTYIGAEFIGDFVSIPAESNLTYIRSSNLLELSISNDRVEPGGNVTISMQTKPNSTVYFRAIDQSVLLLAKDSDLSQDFLEQEYRSKKFKSGNEERLDLRRSGIVVITNANPSDEHILKYVRDPLEEICFVPLSGGNDVVAPENPSVEVAPRKYFPETWLWEVVNIDRSGNSTMDYPAPDSLTSWMITGYSLHPEHGISILPSAKKLTTFKDFFITLELPYSVVQDEQLILKILVHNYLPGNTTRSVSAQLKSTAYNFTINGDNVKQLKCPSKSVTSVSFVVTPHQIGQIDLLVRAITTDAVDAVQKSLRVIPYGERVTVSIAKYIESTRNRSTTTVLPIRRNNLIIIQGSESNKLTFSADILSAAMENLDELIELPVGCGEQNMLKFAADLVILHYLNTTDQLTTAVKAKSLSFLELGYQRELTFQRSDGSFSFFQSDTSGSMWLTALVIRYFLAAKPYISIGDKVITDGLNLMYSHVFQNGSRNGEFGPAPAVSTILDSDEASLAAFCALTYIEACKQGHKFGPNNTIIEKTRHQLDGYLNRNLTNRDIDIYSIVLLNYVEHVWDNYIKPAKNTSNVYLNYLQAHAKTKNSEDGQLLRFWTVENGSNRHNPAVAVEMTSYTLLCYLYRQDIENALPLVRWLLTQQGPKGGFYSTKDTIVALTALGKLAEIMNTPNFKVKVQVHAERWQEVHSVDITKQNAGVLQEISFPPGTTQVKIKTTGDGVIFAQLTHTYYRRSDGINNASFETQISKMKSVGSSKFELRVCAQYQGQGRTNMAIMEINAPSGYIFDSNFPASNYKRHELTNKNTKLDFYFDFISSSNRTCVDVSVHRLVKVGKVAPAAVRIYDYYDNRKSALKFYDAPVINYCDICRETSNCSLFNCV